MSEKPSISSIMKAVANMQSNMKVTQDYLEKTLVTGTAEIKPGDRDIAITLNGKFECQRCDITQNFMQQNTPIAEQLVVNAINDAVKQVAVLTRQQIEALSADLKDQNE